MRLAAEDESEESPIRRVRNYVSTGDGPNDWMVITMAEQVADVLERLGGRCDSCGANISIGVVTAPPFVLVSGKLCCHACATTLELPELPGSGDFSA